MLASKGEYFQQLFWITDENGLYREHTEKHTEWPTVRTSVNQEESRRDKTPAYTRCSVTDISRRVVSGWHFTNLIFADHRVKVNKEY